MADCSALDRLLPEVLIYAPNAPEVSALKFLRDAAREFCERTRVWRDTDELTVSEPDYEAVCGYDADIVEIERAELDGVKLIPVTMAWLDREVPSWRSYEEDAAPAKYLTQTEPDTVTIVPPATGTLKLWLILKPTRKATELPQFLVDHHATEIGRGAAAKLLQLPGFDFSNPALAEQLAREFNGEQATAMWRTAKGQQRGAVRTRPSFF